MADVTLTYKGATIAELNDSGSKTLRTAGKYCEADIGVEYVKPESGGITPTGTKEITINENGTTTEDVTNYANAQITVNVPSSGGEKSIEHIFSYTPARTVSSAVIDVGDYNRPNRYALFVTSDNTENDGKYETIVKGYTIVVSKNGIVETGKTKGRIATLKAGSGTDYWNTSVFSTSQSGSTITVGGAGKYYKAGSEYTFFFYDLSDLL